MRIRGLILNLLTGFSLLLVVFTILLWTRSISHSDKLTYLSSAGDGYVLRTMPHGVAIGMTKHLREEVADYNPLTTGWSFVTQPWGASTRYSVKSTDVHLHDLYITLFARPPSFEYHFLGFGWRSPDFMPTRFPLLSMKYLSVNLRPTPNPTSAIALPFWFLILVFAALPALRMMGWRRGIRRQRRGRCSQCGYDLRASPGRCPECGAGSPSSESGGKKDRPQKA
jgi:hypothetical protein